MTVVAFWGRRVKAAQTAGDRVASTLAHQESVINERVEAVNTLASRTERAAVELIRQGDRYLEAAAARRH